LSLPLPPQTLSDSLLRVQILILITKS
jgi:hypothetical protein